MPPLNNPCDIAADAAESALRAYLHGRTMPPILYGAILWAVQMRLAEGKLPVLDEILANDIDNHAVPARARTRLMMPIEITLPPFARGRFRAVRERLATEGI